MEHLLLPVTSVYCPLLQFEHVELPDVVEYEPATHSLQPDG